MEVPKFVEIVNRIGMKMVISTAVVSEMFKSLDGSNLTIINRPDGRCYEALSPSYDELAKIMVGDNRVNDKDENGVNLAVSKPVIQVVSDIPSEPTH